MRETEREGTTKTGNVRTTKKRPVKKNRARAHEGDSPGQNQGKLTHLAREEVVRHDVAEGAEVPGGGYAPEVAGPRGVEAGVVHHLFVVIEVSTRGTGVSLPVGRQIWA